MEEVNEEEGENELVANIGHISEADDEDEDDDEAAEAEEDAKINHLLRRKGNSISIFEVASLLNFLILRDRS